MAMEDVALPVRREFSECSLVNMAFHSCFEFHLRNVITNSLTLPHQLSPEDHPETAALLLRP